MNINQANGYFTTRAFADNWDSASDTQKTKILTTAKMLIDNISSTTNNNYEKAIYEQALYMLDNYDRIKLKLNGITSVSISGEAYEKYESSDIISPIVKQLLKKSGRRLRRIC